MLYGKLKVIFFILIGYFSLLIESKGKCNPKEKTGECLGYYLYDIDESSGEGTLYECKKNADSCNAIFNAQGYYKVTDINYHEEIPYIICKDNKCKILHIEDMKNYCNKSNSGELVNIQLNNGISEGVQLCINTLNLIKFGNNTFIHMFNTKHNRNSIFSNINNDKYILIAIDKDSIKPMDTTNIESDIYLVNDNLYSLENINNGNFTINKLSLSGMKAFKYENVGFARILSNFSKNISSDSLSKTLLYFCQNGRCVSTTGYLKFKHDDSIEVANCMGYCTSRQKSMNCNIINNGKAYYDSSTSEFNICVNSGNSTVNVYEFKKINNNSTNYIPSLKTMGSTIYELHVSDEGGNIIGLSSGSNYLMDIDNDGKIDMLTCHQNSNYCSIKPMPLISGYFIDSKSDSANDLFYCDGNSCRSVTEKNGYFINSDGGIIRCNSSECELLERHEVGSSCNNHHNEVIYYNNNYNSFQYCNYTSEVDFSSKELYFQLREIDAYSLDFPTSILPGSDTILLKIDQYSVKQVITDDEGICVNNLDNTVITDTKCENSISKTKYYCLSSNKTCINSIESDNLENGGIYNISLNKCYIYYLLWIIILFGF